MPPRSPQLKTLLDRLVRRFDRSALSPDPLELLHEYSDPEDQEVVGFLVASLSYGNVQTILSSSRKVLRLLGASPRHAILSLTPSLAEERLEGFRHRFCRGRDMARLLLSLRRVLRRHGSLEACFMEAWSPEARDLRAPLEHLVAILREGPGDISPGFDHLLPLPSRGSACKRLHMFLRWMVRGPDGLDLGLWRGASPAQLTIPLDTHVARIARDIGLTGRSTADWRTAREVTDRLMQLDQNDPVRYDFAISRLGIRGACKDALKTSRCDACILGAVCLRAAPRKRLRSKQEGISK